MNRPCILAALFLLAAAPPAAPQESQQVARGVVFRDKNHNGAREEGEEALAGVRVSNGREVVKTDPMGRWELPVTDDTILFVIKPRNWRPVLGQNKLPRPFFIHKPKGTAGSPRFHGIPPTLSLPGEINFPLYEHKEPDRFPIVVFGDTQVRDEREIDYLQRDVVQDLAGVQAAFGVTLGDVVFDDLRMFEFLNCAVATSNLPWINVLGNHDMDYDVKTEEDSNDTFERKYGPATYSFDAGPVHFIVLDDIVWTPPQPGKGASYEGRFSERVLEFVKNDLALCPQQQLVVLMMHIPFYETKNSAELLKLLAGRPHTLSLSSHQHWQEHQFLGPEQGWTGEEPHHHFVAMTACGGWWTGAPDQRGIPHATTRDGAPNGYNIITFNGNRYSIEFKAAGHDRSHQMEISLHDGHLYANVFAGSEKSEVEMRIGDGAWTAMKKVLEPDPAYVALKKKEDAMQPPPPRRLPDPQPCRHLWKAPLPEGLKGRQTAQVRTVDMFGHKYEDKKEIDIP